MIGVTLMLTNVDWRAVNVFVTNCLKALLRLHIRRVIKVYIYTYIQLSIHSIHTV